jgi:hypothetical protein
MIRGQYSTDADGLYQQTARNIYGYYPTDSNISGSKREVYVNEDIEIILCYQLIIKSMKGERTFCPLYDTFIR